MAGIENSEPFPFFTHDFMSAVLAYLLITSNSFAHTSSGLSWLP